MALSAAQKRKIEEEEKYRAEVRKDKSKKSQKGIGLFSKVLLLFVGLPLLFGAIVVGTSSRDSTTSSNSALNEKPDLAGNVNFDGYQFHVANQEDQDWKKCWITLNGDYYYPQNAPTVTLDGIKAGETVTFTPGEFTLKDGTRFNPYITAPQNVSMSCDGRFGYWEWN